eukprot:TRINITY_DN575_c7_g1_i1.p3 TRINITY_DN575_c7_g1~~TRINITY_DN575_c7_g1_i1.p3  ORF type:complete len:102 (+),score=31.42 TRINITY_DN575_c7_g1_i1:175-480(+)
MTRKENSQCRSFFAMLDEMVAAARRERRRRDSQLEATQRERRLRWAQREQQETDDRVIPQMEVAEVEAEEDTVPQVPVAPLLHPQDEPLEVEDLCSDVLLL